jgi:hypothetical protein
MVSILQRNQCGDCAAEHQRHLDRTIEGIQPEQRNRASDKQRESSQRDDGVGH